MEDPIQNSKSYAATFTGGPFNAFVFTTVDAVVYEVKFVPSTDFLPDYEYLDVEVYELVITVEVNPSGG
jgi:hypothetical protein